MTRHPFNKIVRDLQATERAIERDVQDQARRAAEAEARLDEPLTRRDVLDALDEVANEYGCNGDHDSDLIADAFRKLKDALS